MSQRLSTSVTFQNLEDRVNTLESSQILTKQKIVGALGFTPANVAGDTMSYVIANSFLSKISDGGGTANLNGSSIVGYTGIVEFRKSDGSRNGFIGFNAEAGPMHYGSDTGMGHYFEGGSISPDPNMKFGLRFNSADGILDFDSGDYLYYSRSTDMFLFNIGGTAKATIDSGGILSVTELALDGQFYQVVTGSQAYINFDSGGDAFLYDRPTDQHKFLIGGAAKAVIDGSSLTHIGSLVAGTFVQIGDANYCAQIVSGVPRLQFDTNDSIAYNRTTNAYAFNVAGTAAATIDATGIATPSKMFPGADPNFSAGMASGSPTITCDSGDTIRYDRTNNKFVFRIGNVDVASIDASGNLRIKGALSQGVTP